MNNTIIKDLKFKYYISKNKTIIFNLEQNNTIKKINNINYTFNNSIN